MKNPSLSDIVNEIIKHGKTIIVGTDVCPPPKMVKKLATILNSKIYVPHKSLSKELKNEIVQNFLSEKEYELEPENSHERDALASAIKTYKHYEGKLRQIDKKLESSKIKESMKNYVKSIVIRDDKPISDAIKLVSKEKSEKKEKKQKKKPKPKIKSKRFYKLRRLLNIYKRKIRHQNNLIKKLKKENKKLKRILSEKSKENKKLKEKINKLHYEYSKGLLLNKELSAKIKIIKSLQEKYRRELELRKKLEENLKSLHKLIDIIYSKNKVPVKIIESFTKEGIKKACENWHVTEDDVLLILKPELGGRSTALLLSNIKPKCIIFDGKISPSAKEVFDERNIPVISISELNLKFSNGFAIVNLEELNKSIKRWKKRHGEKMREKLIKIIKEYRNKRKRKLE